LKDCGSFGGGRKGVLDAESGLCASPLCWCLHGHTNQTHGGQRIASEQNIFLVAADCANSSGHTGLFRSDWKPT